MRKLRIMHVLNTGGYSGAENVVITLINSMKTKVDGYYVSPTGGIVDILTENKIKYVPVKGETISISALRQAVKIVRPDIIHAHDFTAGVISSISVFGIPIISHLHNNSPWLKQISAKSIGYFLSTTRFKKILTVSDSIMNDYVFGEFLKAKAKTIGNPIRLQSIRDKAKKSQLTESSDVMFLGRLETPKNPLAFIEIIAGLKKVFPSIKAAIVGDGMLRNEVEKKITQYVLTNNILLYGFQDNPYGLLQNTKILCMPSTWEGFGLAAVESLALGKPVVAAPIGGLNDIITDSCGKKCSTNDEYIDEILKLLIDSRYYINKSKSALCRANDFDNMESYRKMMISVYKSVL